MTTVPLIFLLLVLYSWKHLVADWLLQTDYHQGKAKSGWGFLRPLLAHVSNHFILTTLISAGVLTYFDHPAAVGFGMLIGLGDGLVHFFQIRFKAGPKYMGRWKMLSGNEVRGAKALCEVEAGDPIPGWMGCYEYTAAEAENVMGQALLRGNRLFWLSFGLDQALHHLTDYVAIYAVLKIAGAL